MIESTQQYLNELYSVQMQKDVVILTKRIKRLKTAINKVDPKKVKLIEILKKEIEEEKEFLNQALKIIEELK